MHLERRLTLPKPESNFDIGLEKQLLHAWLKLSEIINSGLTIKDNLAAGQQNHIVNADGTLADLTTKFNTLLSELETAGILKTS